jgi:hypothetical protein
MTACCTKLPPLTLFLSDLCGKEPLDGGLLHEASSPHPLPIGSVQAAGLKAPAASTRLLRRPREPSSSHC